MKGVPLSIEGTRKGYRFRKKWYTKGWRVGPRGGASPYKHLLSASPLFRIISGVGAYNQMYIFVYSYMGLELGAWLCAFWVSSTSTRIAKGSVIGSFCFIFIGLDSVRLSSIVTSRSILCNYILALFFFYLLWPLLYKLLKSNI